MKIILGTKASVSRKRLYPEKFQGRAGFTLPEIIVSLIFVVIIIVAATYTWYLSNQSFQSSESVSSAYGQARSLESLIQNAASVSDSLIISDHLLSGDYSEFYFDESTGVPVYQAVFYGNTDVATPTSMSFPALSKVVFNVKNLGRRCTLVYRIESEHEDGPFYIEGGVVLNNIDWDTFHAANPVSLAPTDPQYLHFGIPEPPEVIE